MISTKFTQQRVLRDTARHLSAARAAHQTAAKNARRKLNKANDVILAERSDELHTEIRDTETVLRKAEGTGLTT